MALEMECIFRRTWGAKNIHKPLYRLNHPATQVFYNFVFAEHKHGPKPGASEIECVEYMQRLQHWDMRRKRDIRFNFVIAPDGNIYRGRGWGTAPFLPHRLRHLNLTSIYIGYLGDFRDNTPDVKHLKKRTDIVKFGVKNKYISEKFYEYNLKHELHKFIIDDLLKTDCEF